ncbi:MAG: hypothetical protein KatS3mg102_0323 [Planctomycetota bacterium]|nr:MAG: hypothetical protein KatS3mg102_0323 [Planctomycetota bacterium]
MPRQPGPGSEAEPRAGGREGARGWAGFALLLVAAAGLAWAGGRSGPIGEGALRPLGWLGLDWELPAGRFMLLFWAQWALCLAAVLLVPRRLAPRAEAALVLGLALGCRLLVLPHPHSDDVHRYLWEGRLFAAGLSPYVHAPRPASAAAAGGGPGAADDPATALRGTERDPWWAGINHPEKTAIYPPLVHALFAAVGALWYHPLAVKLAITAFDLVALGCVLALLRARRLPARWALLYALNPVVLYAFAGEGHLDAAQAAALAGALLAYERRRWGWMWLWAGLAVQVKYVAAVCLPLLVRRDNLRWAWIALLAALGPLALAVAHDGGAVFRSLLVFGGQLAFNGPVHGLLRAALGGIEPASRLCQLLWLPVWGWGVWRLHPARARSPVAGDPIAGCLFALGATLWLLPTVHFWYLSWVLVFVAVRPVPSWLAASASVAFVFTANASLLATGTFTLPGWAHAAVWAVPALLLGREGWLLACRARAGAPWPPPRTVSAVIPARDEEERIGACVRAVLAERAVCEAIVVDGGSRDRTAERARAAGAAVLVHDLPPERGGGRGGQIAAGLERAQGDVVAIVHADALLAPGELERALQLLGRNPDVVGGALGARFDLRGCRLRALELANDLRAAYLGLAFGDQVQFFRREPVLARRVYPALPLMEDVELSLRLRRLGRTVFLFGHSLVSARRWRLGSLGRTILIVRLVAGYLVRRLCGRPDAARLYRRYYRGAGGPAAREEPTREPGRLPPEG